MKTVRRPSIEAKMPLLGEHEYLNILNSKRVRYSILSGPLKFYPEPARLTESISRPGRGLTGRCTLNSDNDLPSAPKRHRYCRQEAYSLYADIVMTLNVIFVYIFPGTGWI